ncbi:hypothetical protein ACFYU9_35445 [Streptomyces sp. NPDC004327]|uniref:hypothetical protein n=1 Tax=unclassified Streptomyces TaxID=2593676 RepID=UPI0036B080D4
MILTDGEKQNASPYLMAVQTGRSHGWLLGCEDRRMVLIGEFFLASDDESALGVGPRRSHDFPAVPCDGIYPDDAVWRWEAQLAGTESTLRHVVPMANDGFTVFAVPEPLCTALVCAGAEQLRVAARLWAKAVSEPGDEISPADATELLKRVSALAGNRTDKRLNLYCWYFAP